MGETRDSRAEDRPTHSEMESRIEWLKNNAAVARAAAIEECIRAIGMEDRTGRDWLPDSLWGKLTREAQARCRALLGRAATAPTHRHKKRGSDYVLLGIGRMQSEDWRGPRPSDGRVLTVDMREVAIYRSVHDDSLWVRPREEFEDGRFQELQDRVDGQA